MTDLEQIKEDAARLRDWLGDGPPDHPEKWLVRRSRILRTLDLLDSLREETKTWTGDMDTHVFTRFVSEWTEQPTTEEKE